jgi:hypothetical protein
MREGSAGFLSPAASPAERRHGLHSLGGLSRIDEAERIARSSAPANRVDRVDDGHGDARTRKNTGVAKPVYRMAAHLRRDFGCFSNQIRVATD